MRLSRKDIFHGPGPFDPVFCVFVIEICCVFSIVVFLSLLTVYFVSFFYSFLNSVICHNYLYLVPVFPVLVF